MKRQMKAGRAARALRNQIAARLAQNEDWYTTQWMLDAARKSLEGIGVEFNQDGSMRRRRRRNRRK